MKAINFYLKAFLAFAISIWLSACVSDVQTRLSKSKATTFSVAMIPDTQNYLDYKRQKNEGFALDASELFIQQMAFIASKGTNNGGDIAFVASVGDVWQHQSKQVDQAHADRGLGVTPNPFLQRLVYPTDKTKEVEIPKAVEGYTLIHEAGIPFGVAPGNHDHDAMWTAKTFPPNLKKDPRKLRGVPEDLGILHIGGLDNFRSVFGEDSTFFAGKDWYVDSFNGGANAAQIFSAGGYRFLHITLEMQASNDVVVWAESVLKRFPGLPTIFTTHDYLSVSGERIPNPMVDLSRVDPDFHNSAQQMWDKLYSQHDQILMVLCGHQHGQSHRVDANKNGSPVIQILADYQDRGQVGIEAGQAYNPFLRRPEPIGDGWFRLLEFDLNQTAPVLKVKTYSTHYKKYSGDVADYADWYKKHEHPKLSDEEFLATDDFEISLTGFHERFTGGKQ